MSLLLLLTITNIKNNNIIIIIYIHQGCTTSLRPRDEIWKLDDRRAECRGGSLGRGTVSPSPPAARGSGERCKLPQWGLGRSPGSKSHLAATFSIIYLSWKSWNGALWCILKYAYTFGEPNNWKPTKIPDFGMNWNRTIRSCYKKHQTGQFLKVLCQVMHPWYTLNSHIFSLHHSPINIHIIIIIIIITIIIYLTGAEPRPTERDPPVRKGKRRTSSRSSMPSWKHITTAMIGWILQPLREGCWWRWRTRPVSPWWTITSKLYVKIAKSCGASDRTCVGP